MLRMNAWAATAMSVVAGLLAASMIASAAFAETDPQGGGERQATVAGKRNGNAHTRKVSPYAKAIRARAQTSGTVRPHRLAHTGHLTPGKTVRIPHK